MLEATDEESPTRKRRALPIVASLVIATLAVAAVIAFTGSQQRTPTPVTAEEHHSLDALVGALGDGGLDLEVSTTTESDDGLVQFGYGTIGEDDVFAIIFHDSNRIRIAIDHDFMAFRDDEFKKPEHFVVGPNWFVKTYSLPLAEEMRAAVGGDIMTFGE